MLNLDVKYCNILTDREKALLNYNHPEFVNKKWENSYFYSRYKDKISLDLLKYISSNIQQWLLLLGERSSTTWVTNNEVLYYCLPVYIKTSYDTYLILNDEDFDYSHALFEFLHNTQNLDLDVDLYLLKNDLLELMMSELELNNPDNFKSESCGSLPSDIEMLEKLKDIIRNLNLIVSRIAVKEIFAFRANYLQKFSQVETC